MRGLYLGEHPGVLHPLFDGHVKRFWFPGVLAPLKVTKIDKVVSVSGVAAVSAVAVYEVGPVNTDTSSTTKFGKFLSAAATRELIALAPATVVGFVGSRHTLVIGSVFHVLPRASVKASTKSPSELAPAAAGQVIVICCTW
jgi:hypothetical protein